jgi:alternate signal-mediated exported protein
MNKLVKGSIAGAAGIALLLGGAGTLATWNSSADLFTSGSNITAGTLDIQATSGTVGDGWEDANGAINIAAFKVIPGDVLTYTKTFDVTASGDNLTATAALGTAAIKAATAGDPEDIALATALSSAAVLSYTVDGTTTTAITTSSSKIVVSVEITFPNDVAGAENAWKLGAVNLDDFTATLTQS